MKIQLQMTEEHISKGTSSPASCPIALLINHSQIEDFGDDWTVRVLTKQTEVFEGQEGGRALDHDQCVVDWIKSFDRYYSSIMGFRWDSEPRPSPILIELDTTEGIISCVQSAASRASQPFLSQSHWEEDQ